MSNPDVVRSDDPDEIRNDIERTRAGLGQNVDALADKVNPAKAAQRQTDKVKRAAARVKDRVMGTASDVADSTGEAVAEAPRRVASATQGNPVAVGLIAFGVGLLAASLIPASRVEQDAAEKVKDAATPLVDEAKDVAKESAEHLKEPAREAAEAVKDRAQEGVETVKAEGQDAAAEAKHAANRQMS